VPRTSRGGAQGATGCGRKIATSGRNHRGTFVHNGQTSAGRSAANKEGKRVGNRVIFTLPDSNQEIASQIGTVRELVSRNLSRLHSEGLIDKDGRKATIPDLNKIEAEVNSVE
jgi:CRP-like cAMP-binding protein